MNHHFLSFFCVLQCHWLVQYCCGYMILPTLVFSICPLKNETPGTIIECEQQFVIYFYPHNVVFFVFYLKKVVPFLYFKITKNLLCRISIRRFIFCPLTKQRFQVQNLAPSYYSCTPFYVDPQVSVCVLDTETSL